MAMCSLACVSKLAAEVVKEMRPHCELGGWFAQCETVRMCSYDNAVFWSAILARDHRAAYWKWCKKILNAATVRALAGWNRIVRKAWAEKKKEMSRDRALWNHETYVLRIQLGLRPWRVED